MGDTQGGVIAFPSMNTFASRVAATLLILSASSCFNPDTSRVVFRCDSSHPECPPGQVCGSDNLCISANPDQNLSQDMNSTIDQASSDMALEPGCAPGITGILVGNGFACPGVFGAGQATQRCAAGWSICTSASNLDQVACNTINGFFMGNAPATWSGTPINDACGAGATNRAWLGCGKRTQGIYDPAVFCGSFVKLLDCTTATAWNCSAGHTVNQTVNGNPSDGVLCCKP